MKDKSPATWTVADGAFTVNKKAGNIETKRNFTQLSAPPRVPRSGRHHRHGPGARQQRRVPRLDRQRRRGYELQILDSYNNKTYVNGQAGEHLQAVPPLVNAAASRASGRLYDVVWTAPMFNADGTREDAGPSPCCTTACWCKTTSRCKGEHPLHRPPAYKAHGPSPIKLQSHGDPSEPISFRNIWVRELP